MARSTPLLALSSALLLTLALANTFPTDLAGTFTYTDGNRPALCPRSIEHTTFSSAGSEGVWSMAHNTIKHNGLRCNSVANEREFTFYRGAVVNSGRVPAELTYMLTKVGQNIDVNFPLNHSLVTAGENYYIGYEEVSRFCQNSRFFNGTVAFLFRPFYHINMPISNFKFIRFAPGKKYLIMVPRFENAVCVYEAPLVAPSPSVSPLPVEPTIEPLVATAEPQLSPEPSIPGSASSSSSRQPVCFPGESFVVLKNGAVKKMRDVQIGDVVQTGATTFSRVFMFTHRITEGNFEFVRIVTSGGRTLQLSEGHYLYVNGRLATAGSVRTGDSLDGTTGNAEIVQSVQMSVAEGLFNPQTEDGDIIVNGIRASAYTAAVAPKAAHAMLAPLRFVYSLFGITTAAVEDGADAFAMVMPAGQLIY